MEIDKSKELLANIKLINNKLHYHGTADKNPPVSIDYIPPLGDNLGYTSLEVFLLSLSSCIASAVLTLLRKMKKEIKGFEINSRGIRKQEHPTGFCKIYHEIIINSENLTEEEVQKILAISEGICPVWSMIEGNVEVENNVKILK